MTNYCDFYVNRMDTDGTLDITFDEWRNYLLYAPSTDIRDLIGYWRHSTVSTILIFLYHYSVQLCQTKSE